MRTSLRARAIATALVALTLLTGCQPTTVMEWSPFSVIQAATPTVKELKGDSWAWSVTAIPTEHGWRLRSGSVPEAKATRFGPVVRFYGKSAEPANFHHVLFGLSPEGATRWSREIIAPDNYHGSLGPRLEVSPDGRFLALATQTHVLDGNGNTASGYVLLDAESGRTVRKGAVLGNLLGLALTNSEMVIQTSGTDFPAGLDWSPNPAAFTGPSRLTRFPLADGKAAPKIQNTSQWLAGAGASTLLTSDAQPSESSYNPYGIALTGSLTSVDLVDTEGQVSGTVTGVRNVLHNAVIERCEPTADEDADTLQNCELYEPESGARVSTAGLYALQASGPTEEVVVLTRQQTGSDGRVVTREPQSWSLGATTPSTQARPWMVNRKLGLEVHTVGVDKIKLW
ncbi:hypothetical protein [Actinomyces weissii]|uniref:Uncharacterized protein n=1 Tax=Actinomyces weissii TaxID=675090 RepID=A0A7T7M9K1_9ACTO|nr:hypothetical protein [Actinomyces weissii]QQM67436.1 hypothetical protein JG540_00525 [Actinomyces weissii]